MLTRRREDFFVMKLKMSNLNRAPAHDGRIGYAPFVNHRTSMMGPDYRAQIKTLRGPASVWNWNTKTIEGGNKRRSGLQGVPPHEIPGYKPVTLDPNEFQKPEYQPIGPAFEPPAFELVEDLPLAPNSAPQFKFDRRIGKAFESDWGKETKKDRMGLYGKNSRYNPYGKTRLYKPPPSVEIGVPLKRTLSEASTAESLNQRRRRSRSRRTRSGRSRRLRRRSRSLRRRRGGR